jgi:hypothetical protein
MTDFIVRKSRLQEVPEFLRSTVLGFEESNEYRRIGGYAQDISAVVMAAFAEYLCKFQAQQLTANAAANASLILSSAYKALEMLASSPESAIRELVRDEIYEKLEDCDPPVVEKIKSRLGPNALALYRR